MSKKNHNQKLSTKNQPITVSEAITKEEKKSLPWLTILFGILLLVIFVIRLNFLEVPFERDEGSYALYGKQFMQGLIPYVDFYEQKPPGLFLSYGIMGTIFGFTVKGLHVGFTLLNLLTCIIFYLWVKRLYGELAGVIAGALYGLLSLAPEISGYTVQAEHFISFYILLSLHLLTKSKSDSKNSLLYLALSGFLLGLAGLTKPNAIFFVPVYAYLLLFSTVSEKNWKETFKNILVAGVAGLIPISILFGYVASRGAWSECWYWMVTYPKIYVNNIPWEFGMNLLKGQLKVQWQNYALPYILAILGILSLFLIKKWNWTQKGTATLLFLGACLSVTPGLRFYAHYWIHFMPGIALCAALFFESIKSLLQDNSAKVGATVAFLLLFVFLIQNRSEYYFNPNHTRVLRATYGDNPFPELDAVSKYLKKKTNESDQIGVLGSEPQVFIYLNKVSPTRHVFPAFFMADETRGPIFQQEMIQDFTKANPKYMIFVNHPYSWLLKRDNPPLLQWYSNTVLKNYHPCGYADMIPGGTKYVWDSEALSYKPTGEKNIVVWERNQ